MIICEFCSLSQKDGRCGIGLTLPKGMSCREFGPSLEKFCSDPKDSVSPRQIIKTATFFGIKSMELKKVKLMAAREEKAVSASTAINGMSD